MKSLSQRLSLLAAGLALLIAPVGCQKAPEAAHDTHDAHAGHKHGDHVHKPLMGGQLVEVGEHQFNLEFKYDTERGVLQAWVLDAHAENFVRLPLASFVVQEEDGAKRTITLRAIANPVSGETVGDSSSFEGEARWLGEIKHFDGLVPTILIRGQEFKGIDFHFHPTGE